MKIPKSTLKSLLKEAILELINDGEINLINEIKLTSSTNNNPPLNLVSNKRIKENKIMQPYSPNITPPKKVLKKSTGNAMFDDIINSAGNLDDNPNLINELKNTTPLENTDYSQFVDNMHR